MSPRKIAEHQSTLSATGADSVVDMSTGPMGHFALQAKATGFTAWTLVLEGTLDGTNWDTLLTHTEATPGDGKIIWTTADKPVKKVRMNLTAKTGTGSLLSTMLGVPT